ncbi:MAG: DUF4097 family beta strand repeat protein [Gemmatimonadetes bacterium]|nr:DUF4097 family beta strand repeat protein [Gemmatimonadota bacterium]
MSGGASFPSSGTNRLLAVVAGAALLGLGAHAGVVRGQQAERYVLRGDDVAIYNLAGEVSIVRASGSEVVVHVVRGGSDAGRLRIETGPVGGRETLRILYPDERIVYPRLSRGSRTQTTVRGDGTFGRGREGIFGGRRITISGSGAGLEAYADLRIEVPAGRRVAVYVAAGQGSIVGVDGDILFDGGSTPVTAEGTRGALRIDVGSGSVKVLGSEGVVEIDTGSGSVNASEVRGRRLFVDTGSGSVSVSRADVEDLEVDTGSGTIHVASARAGAVRLDTGSGSITVNGLRDGQDVTLDTGSGSVRVTGLGARRLVVDTGSGSVTLADLEVGEVSVDTGSGGITATALRADDLILGAGSGSVRIELVSDLRSAQIETSSGGVTLEAPSGLGAEVEVRTGSGGISADLPMQLLEKRRSFLRGRIGDGDGQIRIEAGSGSVRLVRR